MEAFGSVSIQDAGVNHPTDDHQISRRKALKRGAVIGALVWTPPVVSSFRLPAAGQVGSPAPEPSPSATPTTPPEEPPSTPTPTPQPSSTSTPPVEVGGSGTEVAGDALAKTGQSLSAQAAAGGTLAAFGTVLRFVARKRPGGDSEDVAQPTPKTDTE